MFCNQCGKDVPEGDKFCKNCGNDVSAAAGGTGSKGSASSRTINFYGLLVTTVIALILSFQKMLSIPMASYFGAKYFSLKNAHDALSSIGSFISTEGIDTAKFIIGLLIALNVISIILLIAFILLLLLNHKSNIPLGKAATVVSMISSALIIILVFIINSSVKEQSSGFISTLIECNSIPYFILILSAAARFYFIPKVKAEATAAVGADVVM